MLLHLSRNKIPLSSVQQVRMWSRCWRSPKKNSNTLLKSPRRSMLRRRLHSLRRNRWFKQLVKIFFLRRSKSSALVAVFSSHSIPSLELRRQSFVKRIAFLVWREESPKEHLQLRKRKKFSNLLLRTPSKRSLSPKSLWVVPLSTRRHSWRRRSFPNPSTAWVHIRRRTSLAFLALRSLCKLKLPLSRRLPQLSPQRRRMLRR